MIVNRTKLSSGFIEKSHFLPSMTYLFLAAAIILEVIATSFLKATVGFTKIAPSLVVAVSYGGAFYCLSLALEAIPIGIAYAIWAGVGVALITLSAWLFYGQRLDWAAITGIALIVAGVTVINAFSSAA